MYSSHSVRAHGRGCRFATLLATSVTTVAIWGLAWAVVVALALRVCPHRFLWWPRGPQVEEGRAQEQQVPLNPPEAEGDH